MSKLLYEIILGYRIAIIDDVQFRINSPSISELLQSEQIYDYEYQKALDDGLFTDDQYLKYIQEQDLWTIEEEKRIEQIPKEIDDLKVALHDNIDRSSGRKIIREKLEKVRAEIKELYNKRYKSNYLTADAIASLAKAQFILSSTVNSFPSFLIDEYNPYFDKLLTWKGNNKVTEKQIRELARSEGWRSYWDAGEPFKEASTKMTEEQRNLVSISKMYDNIRESMECPSDEVIKDDDMLDGWLIKQRRKKDGENGSLDDNFGNVKGDMIFIPAEINEYKGDITEKRVDASKVEQMNTPLSKAIKNQRQKILFERGTVAEQDFPDARLKMMNILKEKG